MEGVSTPPRVVPFCTLTELHEKRRVTRWMEELRDEVTAVLLGDEILVRSSICLHMGGEFNVDWDKRRLCCRWHGWEFDIDSGKCLTFALPERILPAYDYRLDGNTLVLLVQDHARR